LGFLVCKNSIWKPCFEEQQQQRYFPFLGHYSGSLSSSGVLRFFSLFVSTNVVMKYDRQKFLIKDIWILSTEVEANSERERRKPNGAKHLRNVRLMFFSIVSVR
jgi:hypothetical protein